MATEQKKPAGKAGKAEKQAIAGMELWKIDDLIPYARNSRTHDARQVGEIAGSLLEFGMVGAIVIREGVIAKGHGTLAGIRQLYDAGQSLYPAPGKSGGAAAYPDGMVPVINVSGWSDAQFRAYVIADNKLALNAGWDMDMLAAELADLSTMDIKLDVLGFDPKELKMIMPDMSPPPAKAPGFEHYGESIETDHQCPSCGYRWSGKADAGGAENG